MTLGSLFDGSGGFPLAAVLNEIEPVWASDIEPSAELIAFWTDLFAQNGKTKTEKQIRRWLASPNSDTAEYKMWGNGIALPCALFVMERICNEVKNESRTEDV